VGALFGELLARSPEIGSSARENRVHIANELAAATISVCLLLTPDPVPVRRCRRSETVEAGRNVLGEKTFG